VFYFAPQQRWYLTYQIGDNVAYSTTTDIANPRSWSAPRPFYSKTPQIVLDNKGGGQWLDFWTICDSAALGRRHRARRPRPHHAPTTPGPATSTTTRFPSKSAPSPPNASAWASTAENRPGEHRAGTPDCGTRTVAPKRVRRGRSGRGS
jgi:hypothetical protein